MEKPILEAFLLSPHLEGFHLASWKGLAAAAALVLVVIPVVRALWSAVYNVFFHPLRRYPGPFLWIAFPWTKNLALIRGKADHAIVALHERLGPVVRITPDTLSFTTMTAWRDIYGTGHAELPKHIYKGSGMEERPNIITANSRDHHRFRRALMPAFTNDALGRQEPLITGYTDLLIKRLREIATSTNSTADISKWYTMTTFDIFGDLAYGESFNALETGKVHPWIKALGDMKFLVPLMVFPGISWLLIPLLTTTEQRESLSQHQQRSMALTYKRIKNKEVQERGDIMTFVLREHGEDQGLSDFEMACNADIIISAGSETTGTAMTGITYYLLRNPDKLEKCVNEIRGAFGSQESINFKDTNYKLPYLMACIEEGLRLYPPVPTALLRETLPGRPTLIDGNLIPEKTVVAVHHLSTYHSENNFHDAKNFRPERWLPEVHSDPSSPFYNDNRNCLKPFSYGPRNCIGRNLAYHEMRLILSKVLWNFDLALKPGFENWVVGQKTYQLWAKPSLLVDVKVRSA
ncbi:Cytochrome P450 monooxygenase dtxS2 [Cladobotryum mycophilum]|uniref:Cytochrome P450 monooxygenase dtxS2 n=1 Tax=Cladobotryum mycophilum TaxID=491253 RepID=A0ABR0SH05_9HYPO